MDVDKNVLSRDSPLVSPFTTHYELGMGPSVGHWRQVGVGGGGVM